MVNKEVENLRKAIEDSDLPSEDVNELVDYLIMLQSQSNFASSSFVFRRAERFHNRFLINKLTDFGHSNRPHVVFEISDVAKEKNFLSPFEYYNILKTLKSNEGKEIELKEIKQTINKLSDEIKEIKNESNKLQEENDRLKSYIFNEISKPVNNTVQEIQNIPVTIYIDTNNPTQIFKVYSAVLDFLSSIDFISNIELKPVKGSWFKRLVASSRSAITSNEVTDRLKEAEYGVEVNTILKPQSEVDKNNSEALLNILKSIENIPNAAIRIGSLIVVKVTNRSGEANIQVRTLSIKELHLLNKKPELLSRPSEVLNALAREISDQDNKTSLPN